MAKKKLTLQEGLLLPPNGKWNFHSYKDSRTAELVANIFSPPLTRNGKGRMDRSLDRLSQQPKTNWKKPYPASPLKDNKYVIRFKDENQMQRRMFGHFFDPHCTFVITLTGYEKGNVYYPSNYEQKCADLKLECDSNFCSRTSAYDNRCDVCKSASAVASGKLPSRAS